MSPVPKWTKFEKATGDLERLNNIVFILASQFIGAGTQYPTQVVIGREWFKNHPSTPKSYWLGNWGVECRVEIVDGYRVEIK